ISCLATIEIVERANQPAVISALNEADAGRVALMLRDAMLVRMHLFVCRAFAPTKHPDDRHLRAAVDFLRQPGRIEEEPWPEKRKDLGEAIRLFAKAETDPRLRSLKHMRDKLIAHIATYDESVPRTRFQDLFGFARQTAEIWERLSFGA